MSNNIHTAIVLPSSENDKTAIRKVLKEVSDAMTRIDSERDFIKDAVTDLAKTYSIPKASLNKVVKIYHKRNIAEERAKVDEEFYIYDEIFRVTSS
jgi:hypothetical protein